MPITTESCKRVGDGARCMASISSTGTGLDQNGWSTRKADVGGRVLEEAPRECQEKSDTPGFKVEPPLGVEGPSPREGVLTTRRA